VKARVQEAERREADATRREDGLLLKRECLKTLERELDERQRVLTSRETALGKNIDTANERLCKREEEANEELALKLADEL
jgi:hypothetical protein